MQLNPVFRSLLIVSTMAVVSCGSKDPIKPEDRQSDAPAPDKTEEAFVISPRLLRDDGAYELLAVLDGVDANRQFVKNLQLVTAQDAALRKLQEQQEPSEELQQKTQELQKKLDENRGLMARIYAYDGKSTYLFIQVRSMIVEADGEKTTDVREILSPDLYHELQTLRTRYLAATQNEGGDPAEAKSVKAELMSKFGFDVDSKMDVEVRKGALYVKVG